NKAVRGYRGSNDITLAMEKGEVDGFYGWGWTCMKADRPYYITEKKVNVLGQLALEPEPERAGGPFAPGPAQEREAEQGVRLVLAKLAMSRPFVAPPTLPVDRLQALRAAFVAAAEDPAFLASAKKAGRDISLMRGEQIEALLRESYALPSDIVERAAEVSAAK